MTAVTLGEVKKIPPEEAEKLFVRSDVQEGLRSLVGFDHKIVFQTKPCPRLKSPKYLFMTDEELKISLDRVNRKGRKRLELIPYKAPIEDEHPEVLSVDHDIQGYEEFPIIFTDISLGATDRSRLIVVREPNGVLRRCNREERHRMNQIYFPREERMQNRMPKMFEDRHLEGVLERKDYLFILDRLCLQFEPDDLDFHRVMQRTFDTINDSGDFDVLRSNRYFGSFVFYLVINDNIDKLVNHFIIGGRVEEAETLFNVYYTITRPDAKQKYQSLSKEQDTENLKHIRVRTLNS